MWSVPPLSGPRWSALPRRSPKLSGPCLSGQVSSGRYLTTPAGSRPTPVGPLRVPRTPRFWILQAKKIPGSRKMVIPNLTFPAMVWFWLRARSRLIPRRWVSAAARCQSTGISSIASTGKLSGGDAAAATCRSQLVSPTLRTMPHLIALLRTLHCGGVRFWWYSVRTSAAQVLFAWVIAPHPRLLPGSMV